MKTISRSDPRQGEIPFPEVGTTTLPPPKKASSSRAKQLKPERLSTKRGTIQNLKIDKELAQRVLEILLGAYLERKFLFDGIHATSHAPQQIYRPESLASGSIDHLIYLYFVTATDRRGISKEIHQAHQRLHDEHPEVYTHTVLDIGPNQLLDLLRHYQIGLTDAKASINWLTLAQTLFDTLEGNPINLFITRDINTTLARREGKSTKDTWRLPGFGPKILSLLALFYVELGKMATPRNTFPVDLHVQRFALSTGIVSGTGVYRTELIEKVLRPLLYEIAQENHWKIVDLSHAIWLLGNRVCTSCYKNHAVPLLCPAYTFCGGAISSRRYNQGDWDLDAPRHRRGGDRFCNPSKELLFDEISGENSI